MSITHAGTDFGCTTHQLAEESEWEFENIDIVIPGVVGSGTILDSVHGRFISVEADAKAASQPLLLVGLAFWDSMINQVGQLVIVNFALDAATYNNCVFLGFGRRGRPFFDASGVNGWMQNGEFRWRQLGPQ